MQNQNLTKWSNDQKLDGLLFFAQLIIEEIDTHKLPALNTYHRCQECLVYIDMVESGLINKEALSPVVDEFLWSFRDDPIIMHLFGTGKEYLISEVEKRINNLDLRKLRTIFGRIKDHLSSDYLGEAKNQLRTIICQKPEERDVIYSLTRSFLTELIYTGYSPNFISSKTKRFFFESDNPREINSPNQIDNYLNEFTLEKKFFAVEFETNRNFKLLNDLAKNPPHDLNIELISPSTLRLLKIETYDAQRARDIAEERMSFLNNLLKYKIHREDFSWSDEARIYELQHNKSVHITPTVKAALRRIDRTSEEISKEVKKISDHIFKNLSEEDIKQKLFWSLRLHSNAISANTREEQLLTFWSSLEGLISPPLKGKINYIIDSITPLLLADYPKKLIAHIKKNLDACGGSEVTKLIEGIDVGTNPLEKVAALISIDDEPYKTYREELSSLLRDNNNVLLIDRLITFNKMLNSAKTIKSTIEYQEKLVKWHVQRIYRVRNIVAHSMRRLNHYYTDSIIENLHSYVDDIIELMLTASIGNPTIKTINEIILNVSLDVHAHLDILKTHKCENCTPENYTLFLFGE